MSILYGLIQLQSQLPMVLISSASLLIDQSLSSVQRQPIGATINSHSGSGNHSDRLSIQIWLWLAASVSHPHRSNSRSSNLEEHKESSLSSSWNIADSHNVIVEAWVHSIFFGTILCILMQHYQTLHRRRRIQRRHFPKQSTIANTATTKLTQWTTTVCRFVAPSSWMALVTTMLLQLRILHHRDTHNPKNATSNSLVNDTELEDLVMHTTATSLIIFVLSLTSLWMIQRRIQRSRKLEKELRGIPTNTNGTIISPPSCCNTSSKAVANVVPSATMETSTFRSTLLVRQEIRK